MTEQTGDNSFLGEEDQTLSFLPETEANNSDPEVEVEVEVEPVGRLFHLEEHAPNRCRILAMGVGGGGCNAVDHMVISGMKNVEFAALNTDSQVLDRSHAHIKMQIGASLTQGLGAGANPEIGRQAAKEDTKTIEATLKGKHMLFLTAGMGGGTGTGAAPVIAEIARSMDILTVAVVTKPFHWEGAKRMAACNEGLNDLIQAVDASLVIPNQNLLHLVDKTTPFGQAFNLINEVLRQAVQGITDIIMLPGLINVDFADVSKILKGRGRALMGTGVATSEDRAVKAVRQAIHNPLLEGVALDGARSVLVNVTGGPNVTLNEVEEAMSMIHGAANPDAEIIHGHVMDDSLHDGMRVTVIAAGFDPVDHAISETEVMKSMEDESLVPEVQLAKADEVSVKEEDDLDFPAYLRRQRNRESE